MTTGLEMDGISKSFGAETVLRDIALTVEGGSVMTLLGPSGCGKTTLLRIVAGLEEADSGRIVGPAGVFLDVPAGRNRAARDRRIGFVFQDYGLWPHMSVFENVAFPLRMRRIPREDVAARVERALAHVHLAGQAAKKPHQLSGGQKQRVSIARAIVAEPDLILLDEPLSNLDANLREELGGEIRAVCKALGLTCINVTHDRREAQILSDGVAVMKDGRIHQLGTPHDVFTQPRDVWTAEFLDAGNLLGADALRAAGVVLPGEVAADATLLFPRGAIAVSAAADKPDAAVVDVAFIGDRFELTADLQGIAVRFFSDRPLGIGEKVRLDLRTDRAIRL